MTGVEFDPLDEESVGELLRISLTIDPHIWTSIYMNYESLPSNPGWAVYRGLTVRNGDAIVPFASDYARPTVLRKLDPSIQVMDLTELPQKKRMHALASAGLFASSELLNELETEDDVVWYPRTDNPFDKYAVEVYIRGVMVGHLPADLAEPQSKMLAHLEGSAFRVSTYLSQPAKRWDEVRLSRPEPREIATLVRGSVET